MPELHQILYATIKTYELEERIRRNDYTFDAFEDLSKRIGHKNSSTLRKMCEPRNEGTNVAKLGYEETITIMNTTGDYRLLHYLVEELKRRKPSSANQLDLFSSPIRDINGGAQ
jgi:hypothetical protein